MRRFRTEAGFSQAELAQALAERGLPFQQPMVGKVERGERPLKVDELVAIAEILDIAAAALLDSPAAESAAASKQMQKARAGIVRVERQIAELEVERERYNNEIREAERRLAESGAVQDRDGRWHWWVEDSKGNPVLIPADGGALTSTEAPSDEQSSTGSPHREIPMAEIRKRVRNGKTTYLARHYGPEGRKVSKSFDRREDARRWLTKVESSKLDGSYIDPRRARVTVGEWTDKWLATQGHLKPSTMARYEGIVQSHIRPKWGKVSLDKVSHADVAEWIHSIKLAPGSITYIHRVLSMILELAVRDGRIAKNPAFGVRLP